MDALARILLGHFWGDYMLQGKKMAEGKRQPGLSGYLWCALHCTIYTAVICIFAWNFQPLVIALIFASHYPIDRWSLGLKWLKMIDGRDYLKEKSPVDLSFATLVYVVVDNTMHLTLIYLIFIFVAK